MADWIEQYSSALDSRDRREKAHKHYIDAYTKLADRTAQPVSAPAAPAAAAPTTSSTASPRAATPTKGKPAVSKDTSEPASAELLSRLRTDLASTQRSRAELHSQLTDLQSRLATLTTSSKSSARQIADLQREKRDLERRLKDRDEELKGKSRLVENVQDEMVGLSLQLNMAEEREQRLKKENEELVRRWMESKGKEAERMNVEGGWH
ncbi:autophagy protein 16, interacts with Atg12p-Atg5p [Taxawa tesnikishii (nom. ined.)]|nr:autophagy protein 16, interacts with Atg12p-Atg5p [Dothideales sp. JES 119]